MGIYRVKRWQWILIGLVVGAALGWAWSGNDSTTDGIGSAQGEFERGLTSRSPRDGEPIVTSIVLQPIITDYRGKKIQPVTFKRLQQGVKSGRTYYTPAQFYAPVPYRPMIGARNQKFDPNMTLADYLTARASDGVSFRYAWWNEPPKTMALWTIGTAVLIGGIWPTLLSLFAGLGLGGEAGVIAQRAAKDEDYFARFSHAPEKVAAAAPVVDHAANAAELDEMNRLLEERLGAGGEEIDESTAATPNGTAAPAEIRKLDAGPLQKSAQKIEESPEEVEVKGEFYPVLIHHKKPREDEEKKSDKPAT